MLSPVPSLSSQPRLPRVELFRLLAEPGRLQLLALCEEEELSVSELATLLDDSQPQMSQADGSPIDAFGHVACRPVGADKAPRATSGAGS